MTESAVPTAPRTNSPTMSTSTRTLLGLAGGALLLSACSGFDVDVELSGGDVETRTFELASFDSVDVDAIYDVEITVEEGATQLVTIETGVNQFDDLKVSVEDGELQLDMDSSISLKNELTVKIVMPSLSAVDADGASSVSIEGDGGDLALSVDGVASIDAGDYLADSVQVTTDGASDAEVSARGAVTGSADGVSSIDIRDADSVDVSAEFAASVQHP